MEHKLALITGASGGIGEAFAHVLAADGYGLVLVARRDQELHRVKGVVLSKHEVPIHIVTLDLGEPGAVETLVEELTSRSAVPSILVNNAGYGLAGNAAQLPRTDQLAMIELNVRILTDLTLRFLPAMIAAKSGGVINVSSVAGFMPGPTMAVYFATKNFVLSFGEALYEELKGTGVTVTTLCPGAVKTGFQARAGMSSSKSLAGGGKTSAEVAQEAWDGFKAKRRVVIPGLLNKVTAHVLRCTPRVLGLPLLKFFMRRGL